MKLLIIDDRPDDYKEFANNLERAYPKIIIDYAISAQIAISNFFSFSPDIVILDQAMGGGENDGTAFLNWLSKQNLPSPHLPIIFATAIHDFPAWQVLDTGITISLFIQKGSSFTTMLLIGVQLLIRRVNGTTKYTPQGLFGEKFIKLINSECNLLERNEHLGYMTINQQRQISALIGSYIGSLERRSQWNDDDIMDLSIFLTEGLARVFDLPDKLIEVLRRFLNIEEILYTVPHYRDHFFHQVKVFLLGFCIINALNRANRLTGTQIAERNGIKLWFMASAFHDIGYPFEKMSRWLNTFMEGMLRNPMDISTEAIVPLSFPWGTMLGRKFHAYHLERLIRRVCKLYERETSDVFSVLLAEVMANTVTRADHGIFSSLILQNFLGGNVKDEEIEPATLSIALHNAEIAALVRNVIGPQTFQKDPLSFLLAYCDLAQDWGRTKPLGWGTGGYFKFGFPVFDSELVFNSNQNKVNVTLLYPASFPINDLSEWRTEVFYKHIRPTRDWWSIGSGGQDILRFSIEYHHEGGLLEDLQF